MRCIIGITGNIGSGKSAVGKILSDCGVPVIDTDLIVHDLLTQATPTRQAVIERFGEGIKLGDGSGAVDRARLGNLVFQDHHARRDLEAIVHPAVISQYRKQIRAQGDNELVAVLVPLLFEAGIEHEFDEIWTVVCDETTLRERLKRRDNLSDEEIERRLSAQLPAKLKASRCDQIIDNSRTLTQTAFQVSSLLRALRKRQITVDS